MGHISYEPHLILHDGLCLAVVKTSVLLLHQIRHHPPAARVRTKALPTPRPSAPPQCVTGTMDL
jgi:hypothetical protein